MSFAKRLKAERKRLGLSQSGAADWLECGKRTLEHWESGDREPLAVTQEGENEKSHSSDDAVEGQ